MLYASERRRSSHFQLAITLALLFMAGAHLLWRGPVNYRGHVAMFDFAMFHSAARAWLVGEHPYDRSILWSTWVSAGAPDQEMLGEYWTSVLPPASFLLASPVAALPAPAALAAWNAVSLACVGLILWSVMSLARLSGITAWLFCAAALAAAPIQTLVLLGQTSLLAIALILFAVERARAGRTLLAGVLVGLAACFKPQLGLPVAVYFLLVGARWRAAVSAMIVFTALMIASASWIIYNGHTDWLARWISNIAATSQPGLNDDPSLGGPWRHQMIHLQVLLYGLGDRPMLVKSLSWMLSALLGGGFVALLVVLSRHRRAGSLPVVFDPDRRTELLLFAAFAALVLLPVYHKSYDAAMLLPALAWALSERRGRGPQARLAWATIIVMLPLLVPFDFLELLAAHVGALATLSQTWLWRAIIAPHHAWATLAVAVCLLAALYVHAVRPAPAESADAVEAAPAFDLPASLPAPAPAAASAAAGKRSLN